MVSVSVAPSNGSITYLSSGDDPSGAVSSSLGSVLDRKVSAIPVYNSAVVALINSGFSKDNSLMHLMPCLIFIMPKYNFVVSAAHIKGVHNGLADALSRDDKAYFLSHYPQARATSASVPPELVELVVTKHPDWTSPHWMRL